MLTVLSSHRVAPSSLYHEIHSPFLYARTYTNSDRTTLDHEIFKTIMSLTTANYIQHSTCKLCFDVNVPSGIIMVDVLYTILNRLAIVDSVEPAMRVWVKMCKVDHHTGNTQFELIE